MPRRLISLKQQLFFHFQALQAHVLRWIKPPTTSLVLGTLAELTRGKAELLAENALLRQLLIILRRQVTRPVYRKTDRLLLVLLARMVRTWKQALFIIQMVKSVSNGKKIEISCELSHQRPTILIFLPFDTARVRSFAKRTFHVPLLLPQSCWLHWRPRSPADSPPGFTLPTITSNQPPLFQF